MTLAVVLGHKAYKQTSFLWTLANSTDLDQMPQNAASHQGLHCLLKECSVKIWIKTKNTTHQTLKLKWTGSFDKSGKFHIAKIGKQ